jgi:hypothetical protein
MHLKINEFFRTAGLLCLLLLASGTLLGQDVEKIKDIKKIKDKKPFQFKGSVSLGIMSYFSNSNIKRSAPFNWVVSGTPNFIVYGIQMPITLTYSETGRSLTHPFVYNFYGASPYYKWATVHVGYRSLAFSDYTLNGMVFNGFGMELKPGKFRIGAFRGVLNPAIQADTNSGFGVILPSYKRIGYGAKLGFGTENNFLDLSFFKGKDIVSSLDATPPLAILKPAENLSFGPKFKITLFKRFFVEGDIGISIFTRNLLNDTLTETEDLKTAYKVMFVNSTTYGAYAGHIATGLNFSKWRFSLRYKQVSSDFNSMGINLMQDDIQEYTFNPSVSLWKGKLNLGGSYGFYTDNLSEKRNNTTVRKIYNTNISVSPFQRLNVSGSYSNFGTTRTNGQVQMNDSITFSLINQAISGNVSIQLGPVKKPVILSMFSSYQKADDRNIFTAKFNNSEVLSLGVNSNYQLSKSKVTIGGGVSYSDFNAGGFNYSTQTASANLGKSFLKNKIRTGLSGNFTNRFKEGQKQGQVLGLGLSQQVKLKTHVFTVNYRFMQNSTGIISNSALNEQFINFQYGFSF